MSHRPSPATRRSMSEDPQDWSHPRSRGAGLRVVDSMSEDPQDWSHPGSRGAGLRVVDSMSEDRHGSAPTRRHDAVPNAPRESQAMISGTPPALTKAKNARPPMRSPTLARASGHNSIEDENTGGDQARGFADRA